MFSYTRKEVSSEGARAYSVVPNKPRQCTKQNVQKQREGSHGKEGIERLRNWSSVRQGLANEPKKSVRSELEPGA